MKNWDETGEAAALDIFSAEEDGDDHRKYYSIIVYDLHDFKCNSNVNLNLYFPSFTSVQIVENIEIWRSM